jgi:hypothetical protein
MDKNELDALHAEAEAEFTKYPGVVGVGYGLKEVAGKTTEQRSFRVYVKEKIKPENLEPSNVIPEEFKGIPTDVVRVIDSTPLHCEDLDQHSPLIGGISITNFKPDASNKIDVGTLGCFATLDGVSGPENVVLLSNNHVLGANNAANGDTIYQPRHIDSGGVISVDGTHERRNPIGKIHNVGQQGVYSFTYPGESAADYFLDCAIAKLDICISSWCNTNCGVSYKNEIRALNIGGNSKLEDIDRVATSDLASGDYVVHKVGRRTSKTTGKVIDAAALAASGGRIIYIEATQPDCDGVLRFADEGDSGSVVVNAQNKVVGLLYAKETGNPVRAVASHIHPVMDYLAITPVTAANPPVGPAGQTLNDAEGILTGINQTVAIRERFLNTSKGAEIYQRILDHRAEVVALVNHRRPVTVAWHRSQGPAFLAHLVNNARDPSHLIPLEVEGFTRNQLIRRMAEILSKHGSGKLQQAIAQYRDEILGYIGSFDSLHEFVVRFELADSRRELALVRSLALEEPTSGR